MGADCKSVGLCLRRFESYICHTQNPGERQLTGVLSFVGEAGAGLPTRPGAGRRRVVSGAAAYESR